MGVGGYGLPFTIFSWKNGRCILAGYYTIACSRLTTVVALVNTPEIYFDWFAPSLMPRHPYIICLMKMSAICHFKQSYRANGVDAAAALSGVGLHFRLENIPRLKQLFESSRHFCRHLGMMVPFRERHVYLCFLLS